MGTAGALLNALLALLLALTAGHVTYEDAPLHNHTSSAFMGAEAEVSCARPWSGPIRCPEGYFVMRSIYGSEEGMPIDLRIHELAHVLDGLDGNFDGVVGREDPHPWRGWGEAERLYPSSTPGARDHHCVSTMTEWLACEIVRTQSLQKVR